MDEKQIEELMRQHLRNSFPLFNERHKVEAHRLESGVCISYRTSAKTPGRTEGKTHFDVQLIGDICYILWIGLEKSKRGRGDGWKLYETIHQFARDSGMKRVRQTPSGWVTYGGKKRETREDYLLRRDYVPYRELEVEIILRR